MQKSNRDYYDEFANWYEKERHFGYHAMIDDLEMGTIEPYLDNARVLEVGCGTGLLLHRAAQRAEHAVGIDISAGMLQKAVERGLDAVQADATALPFDDNTFDLVYSFKVLAHVQDIQKALEEISRVTRRGGHMILEFYNPWSVRYLAKRLGGPQKISNATKESAVYTRWDNALDLERRMPENVRVVDYAGVRVFTPAAMAHKVPVLGGVLRKMEFAARDSMLKYFGGFLVVIAQKD